MKLLFVDDEKTTFEILSETINWAELTCSISYMSSASSALEAIRSDPPDAIIVDIEMPHINGLEFIELLQAEDIDTEIIILSAYGEFKYAQQAVLLGVHSYILKPVKEHEVIELIKTLEKKIENKKKLYLERKNIEQRQNENLFRRIIETKGLCIQHGDTTLPFQIVLFKVQEEKYNSFWKHDRDKRQFLLDIENLLTRFFPTNIISIFECTLEQIAFALFTDSENPYTNSEIETLKTAIENIQTSQALLFYSDVIIDINDFFNEYEKLKIKADTLEEYETEANTVNYHEVIIQKAIDFIKKEYNKDITLEGISNHCAISKHYFCAIFKKHTGISIWDFLTNTRIEFSKQYLQNTDLKTGDIAEKVGYDDPAYFTRIFKKKTGLTPSEYRKTNS